MRMYDRRFAAVALGVLVALSLVPAGRVMAQSGEGSLPCRFC